MTAFKDWNEAHFNGFHAREVADFIWTEAETKASAQADAACANSSGFGRADGDTTAGPDMSIVRRNRIAAPPFPIDVFGPAQDWVRQRLRARALLSTTWRSVFL
jgi:hypothetical protein